MSKVALLKFSNEYIVRLHTKVDRRDGFIESLKDEVRRLRTGEGDEVTVDGEDLLGVDMGYGEEDDFGLAEDGDDEDGDAESEDDVEDEDEDGGSKRRASMGRGPSSNAIRG